jgi:hypothetical protein
MKTLHPARGLEREAHALLEIERAGERPDESLFLATASVMSIVLPIAAAMMVLAFGAAWLFA